MFLAESVYLSTGEACDKPHNPFSFQPLLYFMYDETLILGLFFKTH